MKNDNRSKGEYCCSDLVIFKSKELWLDFSSRLLLVIVVVNLPRLLSHADMRSLELFRTFQVVQLLRSTNLIVLL